MNLSHIAHIQAECNKHFPRNSNEQIMAQLMCYRLVRNHPVDLGQERTHPLSDHDRDLIEQACDALRQTMDRIEQFGQCLQLDDTPAPAPKRKAATDPKDAIPQKKSKAL